ncbi:coilin-like isoform X4 [Benincasa hispida]|uniref:coilin-like isoform X4 n=1 Tax=Benincasa hispida TaxID=102211 RepID=UPI001902AB3E|nr:coilin-like isoform X4 [Benincasa hispida]
MNSGTLRIRLVFEEGHLLSKSQRKNGLKRSWILLKSHLRSISDFSSYLLDFFLLRGACPDGLILSMDGFVLPPFEPTSILKDKDIVRVKKNEDNVSVVDQMAHMMEGQPADVYVQLLANEKLVKKKTVCRKRRALKTLHSSKIKKNKVAPTSKCLQFRTGHNGRFQQEVFLSEKSLVKKHKSSTGHTDTNDSNKQKASKLQKFSPPAKDKRQMMRKHVKTQKEKVQQQRVEKRNGKLPDENYFEDSEQLAGSSDDEEIVPVVIRPGHVRFLPPGQVPVEANQIVHPAQASMDTIQLNGITIKNVRKRGKRKSSSRMSDCKNYEGQSSKLQARKGSATKNCPIDFNKLKPCASLPKADYSSLVDIRIVDKKNSVGFEAATGRISEASATKQSWNKWENNTTAPKQSWNKWAENHDHHGAPKQSWKKWENHSSGRGNGKENAWDEILQAFSAKKANLSNEVQWRTGEKKAWEGADGR